MENLFSERIDDYLFDVYSADRLELPAKRDSRFFSLALLVDGTLYSSEELLVFADECLRSGLCYLVAWGPDCERVHDLSTNDRSMKPEKIDTYPKARHRMMW
jgi:hypothetical protein